MGYFKMPRCGGVLEASEMVEYLNRRTNFDAREPKLSGLRAPKQAHFNNMQKTQMTKEEAVIFLAKFSTKLILGHFLSYFIDMQLSKFTVNVIRKNQQNKLLFDYINKQVDMVYRRNPDYTSCSAKAFMQTPIYDYMLAEWREKSAKERAKLLAYKSIDNMITIAVGDAVPLPGSSVLALPIKMLLSYCGVRGVIGSLYNIALEIDGNTLSFGVDFRPDGFLLTNIILYTFNKEHRLIGTYLPDPPDKYYQITQEDIDKILKKYGDDANIDVFKKEIK